MTMPKNISLVDFLRRNWFLILFVLQLEYFAVGTYVNVQDLKIDSKDGKLVDQAIMNCMEDHGWNPLKYIPGETTVRGAEFTPAKHEELFKIKTNQ